MERDDARAYLEWPDGSSMTRQSVRCIRHDRSNRKIEGTRTKRGAEGDLDSREIRPSWPQQLLPKLLPERLDVADPPGRMRRPGRAESQVRQQMRGTATDPLLGPLSLRGWCPQGRGGSSPPSDTHDHQQFRRRAWCWRATRNSVPPRVHHIGSRATRRATPRRR
jgi:hypothetical protein